MKWQRYAITTSAYQTPNNQNKKWNGTEHAYNVQILPNTAMKSPMFI